MNNIELVSAWVVHDFPNGKCHMYILLKSLAPQDCSGTHMQNTAAYKNSFCRSVDSSMAISGPSSAEVYTTINSKL